MMTFFAPSCRPSKIYRCITARSTRHHTLLHNTTILHTKTFFGTVIRARYTNIWQHTPQEIIRLYIILWFYIQRNFPHQSVTKFRKYCPLQNMIQTHIQVVTFPFLIFRVTVRVSVSVTFQSATRPQLVNITQREYMNCLLFYFYVICKYYHTHEDRWVFNNPYSLQVLHTSEDRVVLGTHIKDYQCGILLRESIMRFPL